ncbi:peroxiredoxin [Paenochrobactrum sp. BZR 588]|uniref:peroxiredoxin n=1 Tax=Paenochrobactrum TaxID=999488 RepID=UPI0035BC7F90
MAQPQIGDIAPDFTLPEDLNGNLTLSSLRGQKVVLFFYPKDDTSGCTKESIAFSELKVEFEKADTVIVGISPDTVAKHQKFRIKHNLTTLLVADEERTALEAYGVWVEKSMYGRKYMGVERTTFLIDREGKIARIWNKVKVAGHAEAVLAKTQAL